jgi:hypothetical protein
MAWMPRACSSEAGACSSRGVLGEILRVLVSEERLEPFAYPRILTADFAIGGQS